MKRIIYMAMCVALFATACNDDDDSGNVVLSAFGPTPVIRGQEISFIGENLDQVTSVIIPNEISVTDITVESSSVIKITVPMNAATGYVKLIYPGGTITTKTMIGYEEPLLAEGINVSPTGQILRAGGTVTITADEGNYLDHIVSVTFAGKDATVSEPETGAAETPDGYFTRNLSATTGLTESLSVIIPKGAATGTLVLTDDEENAYYTSEGVTIRQPVLAALAPLTIKAGGQLVITGTDLDLVASVVFTGGATVHADDVDSNGQSLFNYQAADGSLAVMVPADTQDGAVKIVPYAGEEYSNTSGQTLTMVVPTNLSVQAETRFKAGLKAVISGNDLDLVTGLNFTGVDGATTFTYASGKITVTIPNTADDGTITLSMASTKTVQTPAITLVKPAITSLSPMEFTAGEGFTITGTDLDLVTSVKVNNLACTINSKNETAIEVTTPLTATSGKVTVTCENGVEVVSDASLTVNASTKPTVVNMPAKARPGEEITLTGTNLNYVENVYFGTVRVTAYTVRTATTLTFTIPSNAPLGQMPVTLKTYDGQEVQTSDEIIITGQEPIVDQSLVIMDFEQHGDHNGSWDNSWSGVSEIVAVDGNTYWRGIKSSPAESWWLNCNHQGNGAPGPVISNAADYVLKVDVKIETDIPVAANANMSPVLGSGWGWINDFFGALSNGTVYTTGGGWVTLTFNLTDINYSGAVSCASGDNGLYWKGSTIDITGLCLDNMRFQLKE
jgi:hypothetical protein